MFANPIFVETEVDELQLNGQCSLREALSNAQTNTSFWADCEGGSMLEPDVIRFDASMINKTIELNSDLPVIGGSLRIIGLEDDGPAITIDGMNQFSLIRVEDADLIELQDLVLTRGRSSGSAGAIDAPNSMELILRRTWILNNNSTNAPTIEFNTAELSDAAITIVDSVLRGNSADVPGPGKILRIRDSAVLIDRSEISANTGSGPSTGILHFRGSQLTMINSTLSDNYLRNNAGGSAFYLSDSHAEVLHVTIAGNRSDSSNAHSVFLNESKPGSASLNILNSILIKQTDSDAVCGALTTSEMPWTESGSLSTDPDCLQNSVTVAINDLALSTLADNGGLSKTHALGLASIAIDAAGECTAVDPAITVDQRSSVRPGTNSAACDAGAYEAQLPADSIFKDRFEDLFD
ncbi:MAG: choice-of-anchor Q domain-containing protein [Wenzhouxiangella sp.]|nr:choice-of-anchor Q domain-containing protein [Wenzhouxiangella sp.]